MPVFSDDFRDPTPLPDPEATKVPTTARPDQSPLDEQGEAQYVPSTGSPADALHPERAAAIAAGKNPDAAVEAPRTDPGSPGEMFDADGNLVPNPAKTKKTAKK